MKRQDLFDKLDDLSGGLQFDLNSDYPTTPKKDYLKQDYLEEEDDLDLDYYTDTSYPEEYDRTLNDSSNSHSSSNSFLSDLTNSGGSPFYSRTRSNHFDHGYNSRTGDNASVSTTPESFNTFLNQGHKSKPLPTTPSKHSNPPVPPKQSLTSSARPQVSPRPQISAKPQISFKSYRQSSRVLDDGLSHSKLMLECMEDMIAQENDQILQQLNDLVNDVSDSVPNNTFVFKNILK